MKKILTFLLSGLGLLLVSGCEDKYRPDPDQSIITVDDVDMNEFDQWLRKNYVQPYNIEFKYRFEIIESDLNYYTVPADYWSSVMMAHLVKYLCIDTYDEVAGVDFTRRYFPKMFFLIGEWEYRNNGTFILGTAEGGKKILLSGVNYLPDHVHDADALNYYYIKTIHHEFTHILNQTKDMPASFREITGTSYLADSWSSAEFVEGYFARGFISAYAQHSAVEDFAEMMSVYVTNTPQWWEDAMAQAGEEGAALLQAKLDLVSKYLSETFSIDLDQLRATVLRRQDEIVAGDIDLRSLAL